MEESGAALLVAWRKRGKAGTVGAAAVWLAVAERRREWRSGWPEEERRERGWLVAGRRRRAEGGGCSPSWREKDALVF
ncbi:hypothetical protein OIU79_010932 [Salix purpurea]|uniref:Uncharacterized protein n=1 Tax=Salix purpurea TaxID=77065 RepID=A0A9Q0QHD9_SALPP|nr:hypothetical protein OIU79_010932 [Salix purpurea]